MNVGKIETMMSWKATLQELDANISELILARSHFAQRVPQMHEEKHLHEQPNVEEKVLSTNLDNLEESRKEGDTDGSSDKMAFDHICDVQSECLLVESMSLLDHKGRVEGKGKRDDCRRH